MNALLNRVGDLLMLCAMAVLIAVSILLFGSLDDQIDKYE